MTEIDWKTVRIPGMRSPSKRGPYRFNLPPASRVVRVAFDGMMELSKSHLLCFDLHSPTSRAMKPDIVRGDFGFPIVCLKNTAGTVYRFARGNLKDFFNITEPNRRQRIELPVNAFVFDRDLHNNIPDDGDFFNYQITGIYLDFLSHPSEIIDIELGSISIVMADRSEWDIQSLIVFERIGQAKQLPAFSTETQALAFAISLSSAGAALGLQGAELSLTVVRHEEELQTVRATVGSENTYLSLTLPHVGPYKLAAQLTQDGENFASSSWSICRLLPAAFGKSTILGISDEYEYDRTAALGGSWDRLPVALQQTVRSDGTIRFSGGADPFPRTLPSSGRFRVIAPFAMPKWLSRMNTPDYYRYAPASIDDFRELVAWLTRRSVQAGATHYEVWNEASAIAHWNDGIDALVDLHRTTYETVKKIAPSMVVLGGCTHSWTFDFLEKFVSAGGARYCDGLSIHGYTYEPDQVVSHFDRLEALTAAERKERDFKAYITELGFRYPAFSEESQAENLVRYTLEAASRPSIGAVLWFRYTNPRPEILSGYRQNSSTGYALVGHAGSYVRSALAAYRNMAALLTHSTAIRSVGVEPDRKYEILRDGDCVGLFGDNTTQPSGWVPRDIFGGAYRGKGAYFWLRPEMVHLMAGSR